MDSFPSAPLLFFLAQASLSFAFDGSRFNSFHLLKSGNTLMCVFNHFFSQKYILFVLYFKNAFVTFTAEC